MYVKWAQVLTAFGSLLGAVLGLSVEDAVPARLVLAFTSGGFLYVALTAIFPELLKYCTFRQTFYETLAFLFGVVLMALAGIVE
jgi:zinc transporter ZupT